MAKTPTKSNYLDYLAVLINKSTRKLHKFTHIHTQRTSILIDSSLIDSRQNALIHIAVKFVRNISLVKNLFIIICITSTLFWLFDLQYLAQFQVILCQHFIENYKHTQTFLTINFHEAQNAANARYAETRART